MPRKGDLPSATGLCTCSCVKGIMYKKLWESLLGFGVTGIMRMDIKYYCVSVCLSILKFRIIVSF